jgi:thiol-disulfide isomerase/thioredoxin/uncharacterized protein YcfL
MRNLIIIFFGGVLLIFGCNKTEKQESLVKQSVTIAGKIDSVTSKTVSIVFQDLVQGSSSFTQVLDTISGTFNFEFYLFHAQDISLKYNAKHLTLFVEPSDSLFITFSAKDFDETSNNKFSSIKFSGSNRSINNELLKYSLFTKSLRSHPETKNKSVKGYLADLLKQIQEENDELDEFVELYQTSTEFINWAKNDIIYSNANDLIHYKAYLYMNGLPRNDSLFDLNLFPVNDEKSLVSSMFGAHLWHYVTDKYIQSDSVTLEYFRNENYFKAYNKCLNEVLEYEPNGTLRDIMVFKLLSSLFDESYDDFNTIWNGNENLIINPFLIAELRAKIIQREDERDYGVAVLNDMSKNENEFLGDILSEILIESKTKLIYLDLWATWCGPCRAEIPHLIELHKELLEADVEIISLCLNSDRSLWHQIINDNKMPGKHFFLDKSQSELLRGKLKFNGFPTYMIIKKGIIINEQAPRPSTGDQILNELRTNAL